jgi:hypothetical protein
MSLPLRSLAAIRSRLLTDPNLAAIVGTRISLAYIFDQAETVYPCITIAQMDGNNPPWLNVPGGTIYGGVTLVEGQVMVESFSKTAVDQVSLIDDYVFALLHKQESLTSGGGACFKEIRRTWNKSGEWDGSSNFWRTASRFTVKVVLS